MSDKSSSSSSGGVGFAGLKLTHYIDWSWWWIFSPIWVSILIVVAIVLIAVVIAEFSE